MGRDCKTKAIAVREGDVVSPRCVDDGWSVGSGQLGCEGREAILLGLFLSPCVEGMRYRVIPRLVLRRY